MSNPEYAQAYSLRSPAINLNVSGPVGDLTMSNPEYATAKFLIYSCWEVMGSHGGPIAGSLLIDHAMTKEEALEKIEVYKGRSAEFNQKFPSLNENGRKSRYCHIVNEPYWWK